MESTYEEVMPSLDGKINDERMKPSMRELHELPDTKMMQSRTIRLDSGQRCWVAFHVLTGKHGADISYSQRCWVDYHVLTGKHGADISTGQRCWVAYHVLTGAHRADISTGQRCWVAFRVLTGKHGPKHCPLKSTVVQKPGPFLTRSGSEFSNRLTRIKNRLMF